MEECPTQRRESGRRKRGKRGDVHAMNEKQPAPQQSGKWRAPSGGDQPDWTGERSKREVLVWALIVTGSIQIKDRS